MHSIHHIGNCTVVVLAKNDDKHELPGRGHPDHHHAHETGVVAHVKESVALAQCILLDKEPQLVVDVFHEPALFDVEHLVVAIRNVKAHGIAVGELLPTVQLLGSEPFLVAKSELELVAIGRSALRAQDGIDLRQVDLGNALKCIDYLLLLVFKLILIGDVLELATATHPEVLAKRLDPYFARFHEIHDVTLGKTMLLTVDFHIGHIARCPIWDKHHHIVPPCQAFALGSYLSYFKPFNYRQLFAFSTQCF